MTTGLLKKDGSVKVHIEVPFDCTAALALPERDEVELEAGVTDIVYTLQTDFRSLYSWNSLLDDCTDDPGPWNC